MMEDSIKDSIGIEERIDEESLDDEEIETKKKETKIECKKKETEEASKFIYYNLCIKQ